MKTLLVLLTLVVPVPADTTINSADKFAYGANLGWINLAGDGANGVIFGEYHLSGTAYAANVGWINFGRGTPDNGIRWQNDSADDFGLNHDGRGTLSGFGYGASIGWINFGWAENADDPNRPRVDLNTGAFHGYAYSANCGWINLGAGYLVTDTMDCHDGDGDGIGDPWELIHFGDLATAAAATNNDEDDALDRSEYEARTDPLDSNDFFRIVITRVFEASSTAIGLDYEFNSDLGRLYQLYQTDDLTRPYVADELILPRSGDTTAGLFIGEGPRHFLKLRVFKPLTP